MKRSLFPHTLDQLTPSASEHYHRILCGSFYSYRDTGRRDSIGNKVYERLLDGVPWGFMSIVPFRQYVARVKEAAKTSSSMGVPKIYQPVDPDTGTYWA